ncbi:MAG: hypothetical protein Q9171_006264 [Xanthocarpia ochracea]
MGLGKSLSMISLIALDLSVRGTSSLLTGPTLLVVPLSLLSLWENELGTHLEPGTLTYWRYYGPNRRSSAHLIPQHHVVITTYETVALEWQKLSCGVTPLFEIDWHRVILDEAHEIRAGRSKRARAVCALRSKRRWAMTGTPIQNRWEDLASLLLFIRAYPDENLVSLKRKLSRTSQDMLADSITWICLRRSKASISLPPRNDELHKVDFNQDERAYYELANNAIIDYLTQTTADSDRGISTNVLAKINSLRQICNLGLQYKTPLEKTIFEAPRSSLQEQYDGLIASGLAFCSCCSKDLSQVDEFNESFLPTSEASDNTNAWISTCAETVFCGYCFDIFQNEPRTPEQNCEHQPICELVAVESSNPSMAILTPSPLNPPPKLRALQSDLLNLPKDDKSIIFSFWTTTLDLVGKALKDIQTDYVRVDGTVPRLERQLALRRFQGDPSISVILISLRCGANGLNLTAANHVFLMEPQWNPALEDQALDRVHRMGQTKAVTTVRYIMKNSIEESVQRQQVYKRDLAEHAFSLSTKKEDWVKMLETMPLQDGRVPRSPQGGYIRIVSDSDTPSLEKTTED